MSLTSCCTRNEMWWDNLAEIITMWLTSYWAWDEIWWNCMVKNCCCATHYLLVDWLMRCDETVWQKITVVRLTPCWSWNEMCWAWVAGNNCSFTHILLVMKWDVMRLSGTSRCSLKCHSHPIIIHTWWQYDEIAWNKINVASPTFCRLAWDKMWWECMAWKHCNPLTNCCSCDETAWQKIIVLHTSCCL